MKHLKTGLLVSAIMACSTVASAGIISSGPYADDAAFSLASGATSLTGALPNLNGSQGTSVTLGGATVTAGNAIFVGNNWSSLLPGGNAIAISGVENIGISVNTGLASAFGFYFHEPSVSKDRLDGCNTGCKDSTFNISFSLGGTYVADIDFISAKDQRVFFGAILDENFDSVSVRETVGSNDNEFFGEMFVAQVPEPASLTLLITGLLGLSFARRKATA
jgi:hypothetical protein